MTAFLILILALTGIPIHVPRPHPPNHRALRSAAAKLLYSKSTNFERGQHAERDLQPQSKRKAQAGSD
jgi:hypothetical protein